MMSWSQGSWVSPDPCTCIPTHSVFAIRTGLYRRDPRVVMNTWRSLDILIRHHTVTEARQCNVAGIVARGGKTLGLHWPHHLHLHQIMGSRVTEVQCQLPHQCHQGHTHQDPMLQGARRPYENQFASLQGWGHKGNCHLSKLALGFNSVLLCLVPRLRPSPLCYPSLQGYPRELVRSLGTDSTLDNVLTVLDKHYNCVRALDALN